MIEMLRDYIAGHTALELWWIGLGLLAQAMFSARFLVQIVASERLRRSVVPEAFWYLSFVGGAMLLAYAIHQRDPVFILGQAFGLVIYARNIWFLWAGRAAGASGPSGRPET